MKRIYKITLMLLIAINTSFAIEPSKDYELEKKPIPKEFLENGCKKIANKIWFEGKATYRDDTILDMWEEPILNLFFPPKPELRDIEYMKDIKYKSCATPNCYDFNFKWLNGKTLLVQMYRIKNEYDYEDLCQLWLYEENDTDVNVYSFTTRWLPD